MHSIQSPHLFIDKVRIGKLLERLNAETHRVCHVLGSKHGVEVFLR